MDRFEILKNTDEVLTELYWRMIDNRENQKYTRRLDTILGKLRDLKKMMEEEYK